MKTIKNLEVKAVKNIETLKGGLSGNWNAIDSTCQEQSSGR